MLSTFSCSHQWNGRRNLPKSKFNRCDQCKIVCKFFVQVTLNTSCPPFCVKSKRKVSCLSTFASLCHYVHNMIQCINFFYFSFVLLSYRIRVTSFPKELVRKCCEVFLLYKDCSDQQRNLSFLNFVKQ